MIKLKNDYSVQIHKGLKLLHSHRALTVST